MLRLKCLESDLKHLQKRIEILEEKTENLGWHCSQEKKSDYAGSYVEWEDLETFGLRKTDEGSNRLGLYGRHKPKSMDPEKLAYDQKYLEENQETRSMTTEASDTGLGTNASVSEQRTEEIIDIDKLYLRDLNEDIAEKLNKRIVSSRAVREKLAHFFGLQNAIRGPIQKYFPATPIGVLRECFEALQLYDLLDIMDEGRPRSLRPALSQEEVEKLQDDRPTKYHKNMAVVVVNGSKDRDKAEKIEAFFKYLNWRNEVTVIASPISQGTRQPIREAKRAREIKFRSSQFQSGMSFFQVAPRQARIKTAEGKEMEKLEKEEYEKAKTALSTTMEKWIQNQDKFTFMALFLIIDGSSFFDLLMLLKCVEENWALIPNLTKFLIAPNSLCAGILEFPEIICASVMNVTLLRMMVEIFNKRWQKLDLISMMEELLRGVPDRSHLLRNNLSTLPRFQKVSG